MCLLVKKRFLRPLIKTLKKDITVYKVLVYEDGIYLSPIWSSRYKIGELKTADSLKIYKNYRLGMHSVEEGLHTWTTIELAMDMIPCNPSYVYGEGCREVIAECTIPKGAKYIIGERGDIVSTQLIVNKVID